jgi:hypothetical protein
MFITRVFTRIEAFTRVKPEIEHFRLFGCPIPKEKESKVFFLMQEQSRNITLEKGIQ